MDFVYPSFLFALFALLIPVLIHLLNLRRYKKVQFSNVPMLEMIQLQGNARDRLKKWLLLVCRLLVFLFLILAFSGPYIPSAGSGAKRSGNSVVSIYVDNSYSMSLPGNEGSLLDEARKKAREIAGSFDLNTRFQLLTNEFSGRSQRLVYRDEFLALLPQIQLSPISRTVRDVLSRQHSLLDGIPAGLKESFLVSDFQKNMIPLPLKPAAGIEVALVRLKGVLRRNISVDSVWNINKVQRTGEKEELIIRITESADENGSENFSIPLKVSLNGRLKAVSTVRIRENTSINDTISYRIQEPGPQQLEVSISDQPVLFDNHFYGAWKVADSAGIMIIHGEGGNPFLKAVFAADPYFRVDDENENQLNYAAIPLKKLIILDRLKNPATALSMELAKYLHNGGNVLFLPALDQQVSTMQPFLRSFQVDLPDTLIHEHLKVKTLNLGSDVFEGVFDKYPANPDLPFVNRYIRYSKRSKMNRELIMNMEGDNPFLSRYSLGRGHWYQMAVSLDDSSGNFQRHSLFVPVLYKMVLLGGGAFPLAYTIGAERSIPLNQVVAVNQTGLRLRSSGIEFIPDLRQNQSQTSLYPGSEIHNDGIFRLEQGRKVLSVLAFNYNREESTMSFFTAPDLQRLTGVSRSAMLETGRENLGSRIKQNQLGTQLWKVCLILALVFLALEELVLRFGNKSRA